MVWFFKRKKGAEKNRGRRTLPPRVLAPVAEIVEQGLLVADVAVRMQVKNAIIMNALKERIDYDPAQITAMARNALEELAAERERDARHIARVRKEVLNQGYSNWSESEYHNSDNSTLKHRQQVYEQVAQQLRERTTDQEYLLAAATKARTLAWNEIGESLKDRATHPYYSGGRDAEYQKHRADRIQELIEKDLTQLLGDKQRPRGLANIVRLKKRS